MKKMNQNLKLKKKKMMKRKVLKRIEKKLK